MNDYDTAVIVTSVLKLNSKKTGEAMTKLDLLLVDPKVCGNNDHFCGCTPVTQWFMNHDVYDKVVNSDLILKNCVGHFVSRQDFKDPTKYSSRLEKLTHKDNVVTLL